MIINIDISKGINWQIKDDFLMLSAEKILSLEPLCSSVVSFVMFSLSVCQCAINKIQTILIWFNLV